MGNRISKVYTRTGDNGTTGISGDIRLNKNDPLIQAIGEVDELNSEIGVIVAFSDDDDINQQLQGIQHDLFNLGGMLSYPQFDGFSAARVDALEALIDRYNEELSPLKEFILPGGTKAASLAQKTRAVCRRVERCLVTLNQYYHQSNIFYYHLYQLYSTNHHKNKQSILFVYVNMNQKNFINFPYSIYNFII